MDLGGRSSAGRWSPHTANSSGLVEGFVRGESWNMKRERERLTSQGSSSFWVR